MTIATIPGRAAADSALRHLAEDIRCQAREGLDTGLSLERLLKISPWGRRQMERLFRQKYLTSPARYFRDCQWTRAEYLLRGGDNVLSAATEAGFASTGRLHEAAASRRGMTPGEVRRGGEGVAIAFGFFDTPIGVALIAATDRGVCSLRLCEFHGASVQLGEFYQDFPRALLREEPAAVQGYADGLVAFLEARSTHFAPPLDIINGTTFQREVWTALAGIEAGATVTYSQLADKLGQPKAVRAVAGACARNGIAIALPCHRVVGASGSLSGYRWGLEWKRRLLEIEAQQGNP